MHKLAIIIISFLFIQCEPIVPQNSTSEKKIIFDDQNYEQIVGNVELIPIRNGQLDPLDNPVISLTENEQLSLTFDLLTDQFENLGVRLIHCNSNWTQSGLREMEYLNEINNFRITEFDYSVNTKQPYINYRLKLPKPFLSGNYLVAVYRRANPNDLILTRRFLVFENRSSIESLVRMSTTITKRQENHQLEFSVNYGNLFVNSPSQDIKVVLLQNHNWQTKITANKPTLVRANEGFLEYRSLDLSTNFSAWNDFRFADLRTLNVTGRNVAKIINQEFSITAQLATDASRGNKTYTQNFQDINGDYVIQNTDNGEIPLNADYVNVQFRLKSEPIQGKTYIIGRFNNWQLTDENLMQYSTSEGSYLGNLFLKQGYYEYMYYLESETKPPYYFEGSHFLAENDYEIIVYYRRPGNINDEIIGYKKFKSR